ncbi:M48 family metallopeptidase [Psittacicella hinzii]|uniref:Peptidase M48 domain-containing protein n=1 Tax=Psittacicella hinzii TaxID=2028575 RepID=A0A3A1YB11_9GAMM|nr:M48 family metallopeptidase [Psittacicella hinzii]RIY34855.1 hypothetical protein CKF58_07550 [Psittacicella hinzii]
MQNLVRKTIIFAIFLGLVLVITTLYYLRDPIYNKARYDYLSTLSYNQVMANYENKRAVENSTTRAMMIQNLFERMVVVYNHLYPEVQYNWELNLIKSDNINAYAMPSGGIVIFTGIIDELELTYAEVAAIIGHEMGHVILEHARNRQAQENLTEAAENIGSFVFQLLTGSNNARTDGVGDFVSRVLVGLTYSRTQELQADVLGMYLIANAGIDPSAAVSVFQKLGTLESSDSDFRSDHPYSEKRVSLLQKHLPQAKEIYELMTIYQKHGVKENFPYVKPNLQNRY